MRHVLILGLMFLTVFCHAETEFVFGAAAYHLLGATSEDASHFRNKWSRDGRLVGVPLIAVERLSHDDAVTYTSVKYFLGQNSVGGAMTGVAAVSGHQYGLFRYGALLGIYVQDGSPFYREGLTAGGIPIGKSLNVPVLIGGEVVYGSAVKWHLIVTPTLALTYLGFTF